MIFELFGLVKLKGKIFINSTLVFTFRAVSCFKCIEMAFLYEPNFPYTLLSLTLQIKHAYLKCFISKKSF